MYGYTGKLLFVDLSKETHEVRQLLEDDARHFLGGPGLGAKILYDEMPAKADVFGKDSVIGFVSGPLNNTGAMFGGRYTVVSKSPVTNGWNDANSGGFFGPALRQSGYDAVFVRGISTRPVYIFIDQGDVKLCDAKKLWGKTTSETEQRLRKEHGDDINAALIGPAGENLSFFAAIMNDTHRAAARGGSGAVMGSKKLKAIVVRGQGTVPLAHPDVLLQLNEEIQRYVHSSADAQDFAKYGTGSGYAASVQGNDAGIRNWTGNGQGAEYTLEDAERLSSHGLAADVGKQYFCASCPLGCGAELHRKSIRWNLKQNTMRPEYETMGAFGSLLLNKDVDAVCQCNNLCNEYGFDTISAGSTVAWAMECYNEGVLSKEELDGIDLTWGNGDAIVQLVEKMCRNEGIGKILIKGSREAAALLGKGEAYLVTASGIEEPQHDARLYYGLGRTYLVDPTPGRHVKGSINGITDEDFNPATDLCNTGFEDMLAVVETEIMNASGLCSFGLEYGGAPDLMMRAIHAVTGFSYSPYEKIALGLRMFTMRQSFNLREGLRRKDWTLSDRMRHGTPPDGKLAKINLDFEAMVDSLYTTIGWTTEGVPKAATLDMLGLEYLKKDMNDAGLRETHGNKDSGHFTFVTHGGAMRTT